MKTIVISGVTLVLSDRTLSTLRREQEEDRRELELRLSLLAMDGSDPEYSDIYKDLYGVRPRW